MFSTHFRFRERSERSSGSGESYWTRLISRLWRRGRGRQSAADAGTAIAAVMAAALSTVAAGR
ncbi:hypothetical protein ABZ871_15615 [Streptomyces populi]